MKKLLFVTLLVALPMLSGCSETMAFKKGDKKDDFCGPHINFQYCKCAFHNDYCDAIGMKKKEAKKYVDQKYDEWVEEEKEDFKQECWESEGVMKGDKCHYCELDEVSVDNNCVLVDASELDEEEEAGCKYDSECDAVCEGNTMWKMGCNPRSGECEKTFDTDCSQDIETFAELKFGKVCLAGECVRDNDGISSTRAELEAEKAIWSQAVKDINNTRADINVAMLDANKNCINGIADMTNLAIVEFATRVGSILAGGIPDIANMTASAGAHASGLLQENVKNLAGSAVDYAGDAVNKLGNYANGEPADEDKKLKPHEYIKLNCDLYNYFIELNRESEADLETALQNAREVDELLQALP